MTIILHNINLHSALPIQDNRITLTDHICSLGSSITKLEKLNELS